MTAPACRIDLPGVHRTRAVAEIESDLIAACRTLGQLSDAWAEAGRIPAADLPHVDAIAHGLHMLLVALRAQGGSR